MVRDAGKPTTLCRPLKAVEPSDQLAEGHAHFLTEAKPGPSIRAIRGDRAVAGYAITLRPGRDARRLSAADFAV
jgi:hypothetical protein